MSDFVFGGFDAARQNWSPLPHVLVEALPIFSSLAELKVVIYILRHTWGYQEFDEGKKITLDEFMNGRKRRDGSRIDPGVGLTKETVIDGLRRAEEDGFILIESDDSDPARKERFYMLRMSENPTSDVGKSDLCGREIRHRTEKETIETNSKIKTSAANAARTKPKGTKRSSKKEESEPSPGSGAPSPKPVQPHVAIIDAWHNALPEDVRPIGKPSYTRNVAVAKEIQIAGYAAEQVGDFVANTYPTYRGWALRHNAPTIMTLEHVKTHLKDYLAKKAQHDASNKRRDDDAIAAEGRELLRRFSGQGAEDQSQNPFGVSPFARRTS